MRKQRLRENEIANQQRRRQSWATHQWCMWGRTKRCSQCLEMATKEVQPCTGRHPLLQVAQLAREQAPPHQVWVAAVTGTSTSAVVCPLAVCQRCGGWTFGSRHARGLKLLGPCQPPTAVGKEAWSRVRRGRHPKPDKVYKHCQVIGLAPWPEEGPAEDEAPPVGPSRWPPTLQQQKEEAQAAHYSGGSGQGSGSENEERQIAEQHTVEGALLSHPPAPMGFRRGPFTRGLRANRHKGRGRGFRRTGAGTGASDDGSCSGGAERKHRGSLPLPREPARRFRRRCSHSSTHRAIRQPI